MRISKGEQFVSATVKLFLVEKNSYIPVPVQLYIEFQFSYSNSCTYNFIFTVNVIDD